MRKIRLGILLLLLALSGCASFQKTDAQYWKNMPLLEPFNKDERVLILAPHPDDEAIACAGLIQQALSSGAKVKIVYLTNGDHNELAFIVYEKRITLRQGEFIHMGRVRQQESIKAMKSLGLLENDLVFLGYPDYGTFEIFCKYWQTDKPFRDRLTRISSVPYKDNPSYGAPYYGESILNDLTKQILDYKPDKIFVSHPADVNVDHKTYYLFLQVALSDLEGQIPEPKVYPYLVHSVGWPQPRHYHPELELFPPHKFIGSKINWQRLNLSFDELDKKHKTILFYKSQTQSSAFYLLAFARENELFGDYPVLELAPQSSTDDIPISYFGATETFREIESSESPQEIDITGNKVTVSYAQEDEYLIVHLDTPKQIARGFRAMFYIFGYSQDTSFAKMPKIRIITAGNRCKVFNFKKRVIDHGVLLNFGKKELTIKIPFKLLGVPDYVLTSLKAYHDDLPVDVIGYRKIIIK